MFGDESLSVSEFIDFLNQTLEAAYPIVSIVGELANFRVSKNKWVYFDLKDEFSTLKFFGTVYQLSDPLEDGMMLKVSCNPRLHKNYGFSMQIQNIKPVGEGSIRRTAELLQVKLSQQGLFDVDKKRPLPYPPVNIALITSAQSAAYHDFIQIINNRWNGVNINLIDTQVQGEIAERQLIEAIKHFNSKPNDYGVLVLIRGGGSPEDLAAFSSEAVTRAVAASKIPTLVAIGHEIDISLAELAADRRASTPSHAAEILVPDKRAVHSSLLNSKKYITQKVEELISSTSVELGFKAKQLETITSTKLAGFSSNLVHQRELLEAYNPKLVLERGYSIVRKAGKVVRSTKNISVDDTLDINLARGTVTTSVKSINES